MKSILKFIILIFICSCTSSGDQVEIDDNDEVDESSSCFSDAKILKSLENETGIIANYEYDDDCLLYKTYNSNGQIISERLYNEQKLISNRNSYSYYNGSIEDESISTYVYDSSNRIINENVLFKYYFENGEVKESTREVTVQYNGNTVITLRDQTKVIFTIENDLVIGLKSYENDLLYSEYQFFYNASNVCESIIGSSKNFVNVDYDEYKTIKSEILYYVFPNVLYNETQYKNGLFTLSPFKSAEDYMRDFVDYQSKYYVKSMEIKLNDNLNADSYKQDIEFDNEGYPLTNSYIRITSDITDLIKYNWE